MPDELRFLENKRKPQRTTDASLAGKRCVVTGATSGVGMAAAERLAAAGADLVLVCRDRAKAERVRAEILAGRGRGADIGIVAADFSDLETVRNAAAELLASCPRIDIIVNSAGMHSTTRRLTTAGHELVFCVNHLAPFLLTSLLLERIKASAPSRIVMVNSEGHRFGGLDLDDLDWSRRHYTGLRSYGASKIAQLLVLPEFAQRLAGSGATINAMHPGDVRSNIGQNNGFLYRAFKTVVIDRFLKDPAISGEAIYWLAAAPEAEGVSGKYFYLTIEEKPAAHAVDGALGKRVWELSRSLVGLA
ncbi:SDR family NAD(P)-dependent oxidoreductase [bacterium]|nr:SDR family NAD(P)-dependent oxidoreductase [bacterium]